MIENNGVYGLTKGQFSASADIGTKAKKGDVNQTPPIDPVLLALSLGATFVARGFSGDKAQLVPLIQAGNAAQRLRAHRRALALRDVQRSRRLDQELHLHPRALPSGHGGGFRAAGARDRGRLSAGRGDSRRSCTTAAASCCASSIASYDPTDRRAAYSFIEEKLKQHEYVTGLIHINESSTTEFHTLNKSSAVPL